MVLFIAVYSVLCTLREKAQRRKEESSLPQRSSGASELRLFNNIAPRRRSCVQCTGTAGLTPALSAFAVVIAMITV